MPSVNGGPSVTSTQNLTTPVSTAAAAASQGGVTQDPTSGLLSANGAQLTALNSLASAPGASDRILFSASGSQAAPLGSISALTFGKFGLPYQGVIKIPANTIQFSTTNGVCYSVLEVTAEFKRTNSTATIAPALWIGPTGSPADPNLSPGGLPSMTAVTGQTGHWKWLVYFTPTTMGAAVQAYRTSVGQTDAVSTALAFNPAVDNYISVGANGINFGLVNSPTIAAGGTGYTAGDVLTLVGGTFTTAATVTVGVTGGVVTSISGKTLGAYTVPIAPGATVTSTGGTGSGATFTVTLVSDQIDLIGLTASLHSNASTNSLYNLVSSPIYVPATFFSLVSQDWPNRTGSSGGAAPTFPIGRLSNYDNSSTHWGTLHTASNTINWANLDTWVANAKAFGVQKGVYVLYATPTFLASTGAATAAPYGGLGGGAYPSNGDATLSQLTYFCQQFATRNKTVWGNFFDTVSLWNEPDFTTTPSASTFWWGTKPQFVDTCYTAYVALKGVDSTLTITSPGTYSLINANTGLDQWINQLGTINSTKRGYDTFDIIAAHPYHARPYGYTGQGDINGLQLGGVLAFRSVLTGTPKVSAGYCVTEYGVSSGVDAELSAFLAASTTFRDTFVQRLWIDAMLAGVSFMSAFSLGNVSNLMGNLNTDDPGAISGLRKVYNACAGKTIVAPSGIQADGSRFLTFSDGTTYTV